MENNLEYTGTNDLVNDVNKALCVLANSLTLCQKECESHSVMTISGFDRIETFQAIAIYLVSAISQNIDYSLIIRKALFNEEEFFRDLEQDVISVIGKADVDNNFKRKKRDPWLLEGISHMLIHLSRLVPGFHPIGRVLAKTNIKYDIHDHGLDVIAIYDSKTLGITAGECKAYLSDPSRAIYDAAIKLKEVDANERDIEIRCTINQLRSSLALDDMKKIAGSFWKNERSYLPFICYDNKYERDWSLKRDVMSQLDVPISHKILFPLSLFEARNSFDKICDLMREYLTLGRDQNV